MRTQVVDTVTDLMSNDDRVALVLADISTDRFARARDEHPSRVVNVGIMEQTMVGVAAGFALEGFYPIVHTIAPFLVERPLEQIKVDFGYQDLKGCFVSSGASYDYASEGGTHHAPGDVQVILSIPTVDIVVPGHPAEVDRLVRDARRLNRLIYVRTSVAVNEEPFDVTLGETALVRRGTLATVLAIGPMLTPTLEATAGMDVTVLYTPCVRPFDDATLAGSAERTAMVVVIEPFYEGTMASVLVRALRGSSLPLASIGVPGTFIRSYGSRRSIDALAGLDTGAIRRRIADVLEEHRRRST